MTSTSLKVTVAGIRGISGKSLPPSTALQFAEIFGTLMNRGRVIIGTETRLSTSVIKSAVISGLLATGCNVIDIGKVATPTTQIMVKHLNASGGIMITASHNPIMWNGLKFISDRGIFFDEDEMQMIFDKYHALNKIYRGAQTPEDVTESGIIDYQDIYHLGSVETYDRAVETHIEKILSIVDVGAIRKVAPRVVVDCCNGAGAIMTPVLLKRLGVHAKYLNSDPSGEFGREPEPLPENLKDLGALVREFKADIGFAQDPDADRLAIVNESGEPIGEDYTLVLSLKYLLEQTENTAGKVVATNLSTTMAFDDVARMYNTRIIRTKIGEVNVSKALMNNDSIMGGEGNGGVIIPKIGLGRDSLAGIALMIEYLVKSEKTVSQLTSDVPRYQVVKKKKEVTHTDEINKILQHTKSVYQGEQIDTTDGIKVILKDSWLHVRPSNTEPIIRYFAEAKTKEQAEELIARVF